MTQQKRSGPMVHDIDREKPVLIVEPNQDLRLIMAHQLSQLKFRSILHAKDSFQAFKHVRTTPEISLAIVADEIPGVSGLELLEEMQEDPFIPTPPVCLTLGDSQPDKIMLAVERGVQEVLVKPFALKELMVKAQRAYISFHSSKSSEKQYEQAKAKLRRGESEEAYRAYEILKEQFPTAARPLVGMARATAILGDKNQALKILDQAEEQNQHFVHIYVARAEIYADLGNSNECLECYRKAIRVSPLNPIRYIKCAEILTRFGRDEEIVEMLYKAVSKQLSEPEIFHYLSQALFNLKAYSMAAKYIRKALAKKPNDIYYLNQLALALKASNQFEEAMSVYNQVIQLEPENISALYNKAILLVEVNKRPEAIKLLMRLVTKHPNFEKGRQKLTELENTSPHELIRTPKKAS